LCMEVGFLFAGVTERNGRSATRMSNGKPAA